METRKTGSTNDRQDLLAEMLGVMARLRAAEEPSPADAEPRRDAGSKGPAGEEWLSVQAACDYVHVSRTTMYRLVREGKLPSHRVRGRILICRETLDRCIKDGLLAYANVLAFYRIRDCCPSSVQPPSAVECTYAHTVAFASAEACRTGVRACRTLE